MKWNKVLTRGLLVVALGLYALLSQPKPAYAMNGLCYVCNANLPEFCGLGGEPACMAYCPYATGIWTCGNTPECNGELTLICDIYEV